MSAISVPPVQDLRIGVNVTTSAAPGSDPIADAQAAERLGFDFVSASDHPGGTTPSYETWTLLTWIAAATTRVGVVTRVLGVPFRVPALVAKSAESLDRLSAGRLVLGLGAGYDDSEIASFGLPVRTPGDKLRGLDDAVQIMRGMWTQDQSTHPGRVYSTGGAVLEPKPVHAVPIWLGTFGPRALELTGRIADGWIPSRGYMPDDQIPVMRRRVLDAAERAGRDPAAITCALNVSIELDDHDRPGSDQFAGPPGKLVDAFAHYVALGFTAFNVMPGGEHPAVQTERFATEVLPLIRAAFAGR